VTAMKGISTPKISPPVGLTVLGRLMFLVSPPENDSFRKDLCFTHDVFFLSSRDLRDAWADRREILHDGQN